MEAKTTLTLSDWSLDRQMENCQEKEWHFKGQDCDYCWREPPKTAHIREIPFALPSVWNLFSFAKNH